MKLSLAPSKNLGPALKIFLPSIPPILSRPPKQSELVTDAQNISSAPQEQIVPQTDDRASASWGRQKPPLRQSNFTQTEGSLFLGKEIKIAERTENALSVIDAHEDFHRSCFLALLQKLSTVLQKCLQGKNFLLPMPFFSN